MVFECDLGDGWLVSDETWKARRAEAWDHLRRARAGRRTACRRRCSTPAASPRLEVAGFDDSDLGAGQIVQAMMSGTYRSQPPTHPYGPLYPRSDRAARRRGGPAGLYRGRSLAGPRRSARWSRPWTGCDQALAAPQAAGRMTGQLPAWIGCARGWRRMDHRSTWAGSCPVSCSFESRPAGYRVRPFLHRRADLRGSASAACGPGRATSPAASDDSSACSTPSASATPTCWCTRAGRRRLQDFAVRETCIPGRETASFACSDPRLDQIFQAARPHRAALLARCLRRLPDARAAGLDRRWRGAPDGDLAANRDWRLAKRYVELGNSPRSDGILPMFTVSMLELTGSFTLPDWSLHWVHGVHNWYRYAGDREAVLSWLPTVARILRWYAPYQTVHGRAQGCGRVEPGGLVERFDHGHQLVADRRMGPGPARVRRDGRLAGGDRQPALGRGALRAGEGRLRGFWDEARGSYVDHIVDGGASARR